MLLIHLLVVVLDGDALRPLDRLNRALGKLTNIHISNLPFRN